MVCVWCVCGEGDGGGGRGSEAGCHLQDFLVKVQVEET